MTIEIDQGKISGHQSMGVKSLMLFKKRLRAAGIFKIPALPFDLSGT